jgi:hypothetical protein
VQQQRGTKLSLHVAAANDFADISIRRAVNELGDSESLRLSKTPTTTHALRCFSGLPLFMVNSIGLLGFGT